MEAGNQWAVGPGRVSTGPGAWPQEGGAMLRGVSLARAVGVTRTGPGGQVRGGTMLGGVTGAGGRDQRWAHNDRCG